MNVDTDPRLMEINLGELEGEKIQRGVPAKWDPHLKMGGTGESFLGTLLTNYCNNFRRTRQNGGRH